MLTDPQLTLGGQRIEALRVRAVSSACMHRVQYSLAVRLAGPSQSLLRLHKPVETVWIETYAIITFNRDRTPARIKGLNGDREKKTKALSYTDAVRIRVFTVCSTLTGY